MRNATTYLLLFVAFFAASLSVAAGGTGNAVGLVFGILGLVAWAEAYLLDLFWDA